MRSFGREIYNSDLSLDDALEQQIKLKDDIDISKKSTKPKESVKKTKTKALTLKMQLYFLMEGKKFLMLLKLEYFQKRKQVKGLTSVLEKVLNHEQLKILTPKQILQRLPISIAQVKAGNTPEKLLNEIRQIACSLYREKEVTKKYIAI